MWVGLTALAGVAAEIAVILRVYLDQAYERHRREGRLRIRAELLEAVREGAGERVRPVLMTATAIIGGLLPIMWATVMNPIAAPMVGGMGPATLLTLVVVPALYALWPEWQLREAWAAEADTAAESVGELVPAGAGV